MTFFLKLVDPKDMHHFDTHNMRNETITCATEDFTGIFLSLWGTAEL